MKSISRLTSVTMITLERGCGNARLCGHVRRYFLQYSPPMLFILPDGVLLISNLILSWAPSSPVSPQIPSDATLHFPMLLALLNLMPWLVDRARLVPMPPPLRPPFAPALCTDSPPLAEAMCDREGLLRGMTWGCFDEQEQNAWRTLYWSSIWEYCGDCWQVASLFIHRLGHQRSKLAKP